MDRILRDINSRYILKYFQYENICEKSSLNLILFLLILIVISPKIAIAGSKSITENQQTEFKLFPSLNCQEPSIQSHSNLTLNKSSQEKLQAYKISPKDSQFNSVNISDNFTPNVVTETFTNDSGNNLSENLLYCQYHNTQSLAKENIQPLPEKLTKNIQQANSPLDRSDSFTHSSKLGSEILITQTPLSNSDNQLNDNELRQRLKIKPLLSNSVFKPTYSPALNFGIPSAFGANWGDFFLAASGATRKKTDGSNGLDGSISAGFGLGNSQKSIGLEVAFNNGSIKNFGANGTFDLKFHRVLYAGSRNQIAAAVGWNTFAQYGTEAVADSSVYGAITNVSLLQPNNLQNQMPLAVTLGVGGGNFRPGNDSIGIFAGLGLQVHPQIGIGASWSGVSLNAGVSFTPVRTLPLQVVLQGSDLTDRTAGGTAIILSVSYGFNFLPK